MKRFAYWAMLAAMAGLFAVAAGCMSTAEGERSVRAKDYDPGVMTREGLALARVVASPLEPFAMMRKHYCEKQEATGITPSYYFIDAPISAVIFVPGGAVVSCIQICVGTVELLTTLQLKRFAYPWEYAHNDREIVEMMRKDAERIEADAESNADGDFIGELLSETAGAAAGAAVDRSLNRKAYKRARKGGAASTSEGSGGETGFGTIKGPSSLGQGKTATYHLYVGGKKITSGMTWSAGGTSITVNDCGTYGRAMAGNPPVKSGSFRSGIKVYYNGKCYSKTITIYK